jgi:cell division protein FtsB
VIEKLYESRGWQLLLIAVLILIVPLTVDINRRMGIIRRMRREEALFAQELTRVQTEHEALQTRLEYVKSDDYLEEWARVEARMMLPDEVAIIPLLAESSNPIAPQHESSPPAEDTSLSIDEQWHRLFFDEPADPEM